MLDLGSDRDRHPRRQGSAGVRRLHRGLVVKNRAGLAAAVIRWLIIAAAIIVSSWAVLLLLARRLPPGTAKDLATVLPACATTARRLRKDPRVPRKAKLAVAFAGLWVLSPIDLIPEFLPVIGPLDDVVVVALALRYAARRVPRQVLFEAWPAEPRLLERLVPQRDDSQP